MKKAYLFLVGLFCCAVLQMNGMKQEQKEEKKRRKPVPELNYRVAKQIKDDIAAIELFFYQHRVPMLNVEADILAEYLQLPPQSSEEQGADKFSGEEILEKLKDPFDRLTKNVSAGFFSFGRKSEEFMLLGALVFRLKQAILDNNEELFLKNREEIVALIEPNLEQLSWFVILKNYFSTVKNNWYNWLFPARK